MPTYRDAVFKILFIVIIYTNFCDGKPPTSQPTVSNNDIRDAILQIVNVIRTTEDKLERHEYRERVLGDQLKRGLISIDKRMKQWDHLRGTITRLDERVAAVETILMQKEDRDRKTYDAVDDIQKTIPQNMEELKKDIMDELAKLRVSFVPTSAPPKPEITKQDFDKLKNEIFKKVDKMSDSINKMEKELKNVKVDKAKCEQLSEQTNSSLKRLEKQLGTEEVLLKKYEDKLGEYKESMREPPAQLKEEADWQINFLKSIKEQKQQIEELRSDVKDISGRINTQPQQKLLEEIKNETNNLAEKINKNADARARNTVDELNNRINEATIKIGQHHEEIKRSVDALTNVTEGLGFNFDKNYDEMHSELKTMKKLDDVMVQTADNVLDTKKRLEYGVHQILGELGQLMKSATKDISRTISDRFDVFELSVLDEENGALANLTSKIGDEIDQVWRQIGIMHQKMNANADILTKLQNQTDTYVNGSANVMDNIKGKVANITSKIVELDENLNYLMGKLLLVSHEFSEIKTGLSKALDEIKGTFNAVQEKIKDPGPGPHKIQSDEDDDIYPNPARKRSVN